MAKLDSPICQSLSVASNKADGKAQCKIQNKAFAS